MAKRNGKEKMKSNIAIRVKNVSKTFRIPKERKSQLKHYFLNPFHKPDYAEFDAVKNISFNVKKGEFLGIIGRNGSGKSTMLKMLASIYQPTEGKIKVNGRVTPFLELGVGFNPELSARENIFLNGTILGMTRKHLEKIFDDIVDFAEIREFIDMPVKNFSSGMQVRLAFAIAIQSDADVYLVDEVLAVGDANFQEKCFDVFRRFKKEGKTVVFVSHDLGSVELFCDRAVWINEGSLELDDEVSDTINAYQNKISEKTEKDFNNIAKGKCLKKKDFKDICKSVNPDITKDSRWGTREIEIKKIKFLKSDGEESYFLKQGEDLTVKIEIEATQNFEGIVAGCSIHRIDGIHITGFNNRFQPFTIKRGESIIEIHISENQFNRGDYVFTFGIFDKQIKYTYDYLHQLVLFKVQDNYKFSPGLFTTKHKWILKN